jgi:hypothetical protein
MSSPAAPDSLGEHCLPLSPQRAPSLSEVGSTEGKEFRMLFRTESAYSFVTKATSVTVLLSSRFLEWQVRDVLWAKLGAFQRLVKVSSVREPGGTILSMCRMRRYWHKILASTFVTSLYECCNYILSIQFMKPDPECHELRTSKNQAAARGNSFLPQSYPPHQRGKQYF